VGEVADHEYVPDVMPVKLMVEPVADCVASSNVTDQLVPKGKPVSVNVTEGKESKMAVTVPDAFIVAIVEDAVEETKVIG